MTHQRVRKFNTKDTYPEQNLDNDLCQAVVTRGGALFGCAANAHRDLDDAKNIDSPTQQNKPIR